MYLNGETINQERCVDDICRNDASRKSGCFLCSNETGSEKCKSCIDNYVLFYGNCTGCLSTEVCPFNNTGTVKCTNKDHSHCGFFSVGCVDHQCDKKGITIMIVCGVALIILVVTVVLVVRFIKKRNYMGYIKMNQDALFSDAFEGIDLIEFNNALSQEDFGLFFISDYSW